MGSLIQSDQTALEPRRAGGRLPLKPWSQSLLRTIHFLSLLLNHKTGADHSLTKPLVDYGNDSIGQETISLDGVRVVIIEGTYTALLRRVNCRVFIARNRLDTLEHRKKRSRGSEAGDPFIEDILRTEHKIISGFRYLADIIITKDYGVTFAADIKH